MTVNDYLAMERPTAQKSQNIDIPMQGAHQFGSANYSGDHSLVPDTSMYASSPNSLFMYEQERADMLNSYGMQRFPYLQQQLAIKHENKFTVCSQALPQISEASLADELLSIESEDLYRGRCSSQISSSLESTGNVHPDAIRDTGQFVDIQNDDLWVDSDNLDKLSSVFQIDEVGNGPTLAELNCDASLFADLDPNLLESMLNGDMTNTDWNNPNVPSARASPAPNLPVNCSVSNCPTIAYPAGSGIVKSEHLGAAAQRNEPVNSFPVHRVSAAIGRPPMNEDTASVLPVVKIEPEKPVVDCSSHPESALKCLLERRPKVVKVEPDEDVAQQQTEMKWQQVRQFIHDEEPTFLPIAKSKGSRIRRESNTSNDMDSDCMDEGSDDPGWMSDAESVDSWSSNKSVGKKHGDRYFWQYNAQSKGPKGQRLHIPKDEKDPHVLSTFHDPVFDNDQLVVPIRHGGKARRGDGNDVFPNPRKLFQIGCELKKLNKTIESLTPTCDIPASVRNKTRREKNKLASRACRLKKKAQHEANKLKLFGLEEEHQQLMIVLSAIKELIVQRVLHPDDWNDKKLIDELDNLIKKHLSSMIAGHTSDYVTNILDKVVAGDPTGGIKRRR